MNKNIHIYRIIIVMAIYQPKSHVHSDTLKQTLKHSDKRTNSAVL